MSGRASTRRAAVGKAGETWCRAEGARGSAPGRLPGAPPRRQLETICACSTPSTLPRPRRTLSSEAYLLGDGGLPAPLFSQLTGLTSLRLTGGAQQELPPAISLLQRLEVLALDSLYPLPAIPPAVSALQAVTNLQLSVRCSLGASPGAGAEASKRGSGCCCSRCCSCCQAGAQGL